VNTEGEPAKQPTALGARALVLNRNWVPITSTTVRRALLLVYKGLARVIAPETYETYCFETWINRPVPEGGTFIRAVSLHFSIPEAILLGAYDAIPHSHVPFTRKNLYRRDRHTCQYCGGRPGNGELTIDHIIPRSKGGRSTWTNCVVACTRCNTRKSNRTPAQMGMRLLSRPGRPRWQTHFGLPETGSAWERFVPQRDTQAG
jgi:5-methylcytosine-specific restriction endonuclease McrA